MSKKTSYRSVRKNRFTQISNDFLWDKNITLQAKGLLSIFLSNADDWDLNMKEIIQRSKNGRDAHYKIVNELITHGYFARVEIKSKNANGKEVFEKMEYIFSDNKSDVENELKNIKDDAQSENKQVSIEYKDQSDKKKKSKSKEKETPHTENQDTEVQEAEKTPHTENQDTENEYTENQYINNTNSNNTNSNNTNLEEEELYKEQQEKNIAYLVLNDYLNQNKIDQKTINLIIKELSNRTIDLFSMKDVENQFNHMMDKLTSGEVDNHNGFATYFVNGLEMRTSQSRANKQYQEEKMKEHYLAMQQRQQRDTSIYYNWLEDA